MTTDQFYDSCIGKSIEFKKKAIDNLKAALATKADGQWDEAHCLAIQRLIGRISLSIIIEMEDPPLQDAVQGPAPKQ